MGKPKNTNTASSVRTTRTSQSEIHVFDGKNYEEWRIRFVTTLTREGVRQVIKSPELEKQYLSYNDEETREEKMSEYAILQDTAQSILLERLEDKHLCQIRKYLTVQQMLDHLDQKFRITSKIGLVSARDEYQQLRLRLNNDMEKFIDLFEEKAGKYEDAGGELSDNDKVIQLSIALPNEFESVMDWHKNQDEDNQSFESFAKKVTEKFNCLKKKLIVNLLNVRIIRMILVRTKITRNPINPIRATPASMIIVKAMISVEKCESALIAM